MKMTKVLAKSLNRKVYEALQSVAKDMGLDVRPGNARFFPDAGTCTVKCEFQIPATKQGFDNRMAAVSGARLKIGEKFTRNGHTWTFVSWNPRRFKYPVTAAREDGKLFRMEASTVQ